MPSRTSCVVLEAKEVGRDNEQVSHIYTQMMNDFVRNVDAF